MESVDENNVIADLEIENWHIPRPTLALGRGSLTSLGSTSTNSTHSARSGSLLLTAANLTSTHPQTNDRTINNQQRVEKQENIKDNLRYYAGNDRSSFGVVGDCGVSKGDFGRDKDVDSVSMASSTHFTVVNVNSRPNVRKRSCCRKHQLTVLVVSMSVLILGGIMAAILFMELRARKQQF